jgi:PAS domain S-box-containing protein
LNYPWLFLLNKKLNLPPFAGYTSIHKILENALDAVIAIDEQSRIVEWNQQAEKTFGWTKAEALGLTLPEMIIPTEFRQQHLKGLKNFLETGDGPILNTRIEVTALKRSGEVIPVELTVMPIIKDGSLLFYSFVRDISYRKRLQAEKDTLYQVTSLMLSDPLQLSERLRMLTGVLVPEVADGCVIRVHSNEEIVVRADTESKEPFLKYLNEHSAVFPILTEENDLHGLGQSLISVPISAHGEELGAIHLLRKTKNYVLSDIDFAHELALRAAYAIYNARLFSKVEEAVKLRDEFLSIASHELKTPVTAMSLQTQLVQHRLKKEKNLDLESLNVFVDVSSRNIEKMTRLIDEMLDVSRISHGQFRFNFKKGNLTELVQETVDKFLPQLNAHGFSVELNLAPQVFITCDQLRIEQVLSNLFSNAVKYATTGKLIITLAEHSEKDILFSIKDFGPGLSQEGQKKIFQRFERAEASQMQLGLGLGLYICQQIVEGHGGEIWVESKEGQGANFKVRLPKHIENK